MNRLPRKNLGQRREQHLLCFCFRHIRVGWPGCLRQLHGLERLAVDLARCQARHLDQRLKSRRHHIRRQALRQCRTQLVYGARLIGRHIKGHQLIHAVILAQQYRRGTHAGLLSQHSFDLAQLYAKAANLDLIVGPAQTMNLPMLIDTGQIARAIQACVMRPAGPGVEQEFFSRQFRPAQITGGHARPGNAQLSHLALGQAHQLGGRACRKAVSFYHLHDDQAVIGQRRANRHRLARLELCQTGRHRGLGGSIGVEHLARCIGPARHQRFRAHLAAQIDQAQVRNVLGKQRQQCRHRMQYRDLLLHQRAGQGLGVTRNLARSQPQRGTRQIADPDFLKGHIKGHREALINLVALAHPQPCIFTAQKVADAALRNGNALGLAR